MSPQIAPTTVHSVAWEAGRALESLSLDVETAESLIMLLAQSQALDERGQSAMSGLGILLTAVRSRIGNLQLLFDDTARLADASRDLTA